MGAVDWLAMAGSATNLTKEETMIPVKIAVRFLLLSALFMVPVSSFGSGACCQTADGNCMVVDSTSDCPQDAQWSFMTGTCINNKCEATLAVPGDPKPIRPHLHPLVAWCPVAQEAPASRPIDGRL
jgi:hypothetical protein